MSDSRIAIILEKTILWYDLNGLFRSASDLDVPDSLIDAAFHQEELILLTARRLYRLTSH